MNLGVGLFHLLKNRVCERMTPQKNITFTKRLGKKKTSLIQKGWERKKHHLYKKVGKEKKHHFYKKVGKEKKHHFYKRLGKKKKHHFYKKVGKEKNHLLIFVRPLFRATARLKPLGILRRRLRPEILTSILSERHRVFFPTKKKQNTT